ncbi:transporter [Promicromonospora sukumoe]|uniref:SLAC1 family transporter n=1 Tax=Promicromonospora sukumoe TaxID=88382 RepID=UPI003658E0B0
MTQQAALRPAGQTQHSTTPRTRPNALAPAFGISGLAGTWTTAESFLDAPPGIELTLWATALLLWATTLTRWAIGAHRAGALRADLVDPVTGPFAALAPTVALLLGGRVASEAPGPGTVVVLVAAAAGLLYAAVFLASLATRPRDVTAIHGGYLLPTVATGLLSAQALAQVGLHRAALAAFAVGVLFWALITAIVLTRLALAPALPDALVPTLAIVSAPPAVAGNAWFAMTGGTPDSVQDALLGTFVLFIALQLALVGRYRRLRFGPSFWALTFTTAASATYAVRWLAATQPAAWQI